MPILCIQIYSRLNVWDNIYDSKVYRNLQTMQYVLYHFFAFQITFCQSCTYLLFAFVIEINSELLFEAK